MTSTQSHNKFQDNYFYIQKFDGKMQPVSPGAVLGIPTPLQWTVGDGPIEPRLFQVNDTIYVTFNTGTHAKHNQIVFAKALLFYFDRRSLHKYVHYSLIVCTAGLSGLSHLGQLLTVLMWYLSFIKNWPK